MLCSLVLLKATQDKKECGWTLKKQILAALNIKNVKTLMPNIRNM